MPELKHWQFFVAAVALVVALLALAAPGPMIAIVLGNGQLISAIALCVAGISVYLLRSNEKKLR